MLPPRPALRLVLTTALVSGVAFADERAPVVVGGEPVSEAVLREASARCPAADFARCVREDFSLRVALAREARSRGLTKNSRFLRTEQLLLAEALERALDERDPTEDAVDAYLAEHRREFERPLRIHAWRILVGSEAEARAILAELGERPVPERFRQLCREKSLDKATSERGGDLGMLWPDGTTDLPQVRAEPNLYAALLEVPEGRLLPEPVAEGRSYAVLWRRDSLPPESWPLERRRKLAGERLRERNAAESRAALLAELRRAALSNHHPELLDRLPKDLARASESPASEVR